MFQRVFLFLISFFILTDLCWSQNIVRDGHVEAHIIAETLSIQTGQPVWVAIHLKMDDQWHVYWKNPGDSGLAPTIQWMLPPSFKAGDIHWPWPKRIEQPPLVSYGYEHDVWLLTQIDIPLEPLEEVTLKARVDWLVCKVECIPGHADVSLTLPVINQTPQNDPIWSEDFNKARFNWPLNQSSWDVSFRELKDRFLLHLEQPSAKSYPISQVYFFPEREDIIDHAGVQTLKPVPGGYELEIPRSTLTRKPIGQLKGVLWSKEGWRGPQSEQAFSVDATLKTPLKTTAPAPLTLGLALLFALLGGLILNLMPCVLPVLSLKILGFMKQAGQDAKKLRLQGLVFTAGVLASFWVLAGALLLFQATGQHIGWGFQFQSPVFLIALSVIFLLFALNLFGLFEIILPVSIRGPKANSGLVGVFFNGALATLTATPCTAPFMGTALGFALTQPPWVSFLIFTALGLGMASPYLLLSFAPGLLRYLPKPGPWMIGFKRFLGVLMMATVLWLGWLLALQGGYVNSLSSSYRGSETSINWQTYSPQLLNQLRSEGRIVFIDFTAQWCLTCQVNERVALHQEAVVAELRRLNVVMLKADWTKQDATIAQALASYGKNSIPLYVLYQPLKDEPVFLPEILTPNIVLEALKKLE